MCGRFALIVSGEAVAEQFELAETPFLASRFNIAPTQPVAAVRLAPHCTQRELAHFHWGLIPSWAKDTKMSARLINARAETVSDKPSFRAAFKRRRCLIPASGFYEWQPQGSGKKQPVFIQAQDGGLLALAGLWETWHAAEGGEIDSCTILTTTPHELMAPIHHRSMVCGSTPATGLRMDCICYGRIPPTKWLFTPSAPTSTARATTIPSAFNPWQPDRYLVATRHLIA